jgi:hypothetical protein
MAREAIAFQLECLTEEGEEVPEEGEGEVEIEQVDVAVA